MNLACRPVVASSWRRIPNRLVAVGAAAVGRRHLAQGIPCQDAVATSQFGKTSIAVLADGAGSAQAAEVGARVTVDAVVSLLRQRFDEFTQASAEDFGRILLGRVQRAIGAVAKNMSLAPRELACTLLACASDGQHMLLLQLGDGRVGVRARSTGQWHLLFEPAKGEFSNETVFVTSEAAASNLCCARIAMSEIDAAVLMSDGAEASLFNRQSSAFAPAVETLRQWACKTPSVAFRQALRQSLEQAVRMRTMDDCSVAFVIDRQHVSGTRLRNRSAR